MSSPVSTAKAARVYIEIGGSSVDGTPGERIAGWQGLQVVRSIDSAADAFSFDIPFNPSPENLRRFRPYLNQRVRVFADDELVISGYLEMVTATTSAGQRTLNLQGRSVTGVLIDWSAGPPFQFQGLTFNQIANKIAHPYLVYATPDTKQLDDVQIEPGQTVYQFLSSLASVNGLYGRAVADQEAIQFVTLGNTAPVADLVEGDSPVQSVSAMHDVTKLHHTYQIIAEADGNPDISASVTDRRMAPAIRGKKIVQPSQTSADYTAAARLLRSRATIESYSPSATVTGWTYGKGKFWRGGDVVRVYAPGAFIVKPSLLIIQRATFTLDESGGQVTTLEMALPETFSNTYPEVLPWED
jgi:prophage tail gpP-like protein